MPIITIYDASSGEIRNCGVCPSQFVDAQVKEGQALFMGDSTGFTHIKDGAPVYIAPTLPPPTAEEVTRNLTRAVQLHLDTAAATRNYDGILSLCTYATSTNPTFQAEGQAGVEWRDAVWAYCYQVLADVQLELRAIPSPEELIAELPEINW